MIYYDLPSLRPGCVSPHCDRLGNFAALPRGKLGEHCTLLDGMEHEGFRVEGLNPKIPAQTSKPEGLGGVNPQPPKPYPE